MARPRVHDEQLRSRLLADAGRLVTERGVDGLSLRTLAAHSDTSTTAVYSLFGGKTGLLSALYEDSFDSFGRAQRGVPITGDTFVDLAALGRAYLDWARRNPHLYGVMFGQTLAGFDKSPEQSKDSESTMGPLVEVIRGGVESGLLAGDPAIIAFSVWAAVHGVVSLIFADCAPPDADVQRALFTATAEAIVKGWVAPGRP